MTQSDNSKVSILLVDDDPMNTMLLRSVLKAEGYHTQEALSGAEALAKVEVQSFDLILLDIMMPEMNGFEVCSSIKQNASKKDIPIIFITARNDIESISTAFEVGGVDYITKPFKKTELLARVSTHVKLKLQHQELIELNANLDWKVKQRTNALLDANRKIKNYASSLKTSNEQLAHNNNRLRETLDELTQTKIGKKATTIAFGVAFVLFLLSEAVIDPIIDGHYNNFIMGLGFKSIIALLFKPIEMGIEYWLNQARKKKKTIIPDIPAKHTGIFNLEDL